MATPSGSKTGISSGGSWDDMLSGIFTSGGGIVQIVRIGIRSGCIRADTMQLHPLTHAKNDCQYVQCVIQYCIRRSALSRSLMTAQTDFGRIWSTRLKARKKLFFQKRRIFECKSRLTVIGTISCVSTQGWWTPGGQAVDRHGQLVCTCLKTVHLLRATRLPPGALFSVS